MSGGSPLLAAGGCPGAALYWRRVDVRVAIVSLLVGSWVDWQVLRLFFDGRLCSADLLSGRF